MEYFYDGTKPKKKEKSHGKLVVQQRMRLAMGFLHPLRPIIAETWLLQGDGNKSKAFGRALKKLMQDGIEGQYPEQYILPDRVAISLGLLPGVTIEEVAISEQLVEVYFSSNENPLSRNTDEVVLIAYSPELQMAGKNERTYYRKEEYLAMELPVHFADGFFHLYLYVRSAKGNQYSKSIYLGGFEGYRGSNRQ
ncbi:hypothetical protein GCM10023231_16470 [Olivibacter ginsenosidimutans]|uniref:DUF4469 domain-containing protein n=1 Tax=Olivibacter ginsenosidimutans TaxID=1176537 RepID=A0ABP9B1J5_9SPHI